MATDISGPTFSPGSNTIPSDPSNYSSWMAQQFGPNWGQNWSNSGGNMGPLGPGQPIPSGMGPSASKPWLNPSGWDPRSITSDPNYSRLTQIGSNGSGAPAQFRSDVAPVLSYYQKALASGDPLGTATAPENAFNQAMASNRAAGKTQQRQVNDMSGGVNSMANPALLQFMKQLGGFGQAQGIGGAANAAANSKIAERSSTAQFQAGIASAMKELMGQMAGVTQTDQGQQINAAQGALGASGSANNIWAQLMQQLLMGSMKMPGGPPQPLFSNPDAQQNTQLQQLLNFFKGLGVSPT